jgi:hypothetical protein
MRVLATSALACALVTGLSATAEVRPLHDRLRSCLELKGMTKERLDCYDAILPPQTKPEPVPAKVVTDCRFSKDENERLTCFNQFAEKPGAPKATPAAPKPVEPKFAQTCCPEGCAPEGERCVTTGALWTRCIPIACADGSRRPSAGSSGPTREQRKSAVLARPLRTARAYVAPREIPSECPLMNPTKAQVDEATNQCVNTLTGRAQFRGCFFEDDVGRAEDKRTGLSCHDRQAALAKQCLKRCTNYASDTTHLVCTGSYPNTVWRISFGDISGDTGDSARVDLCGPRLRASASSRLR